MPAILTRLVNQLKAKGYDDKAARAIAVAALRKSGNLQKDSEEPTSKGRVRGAMTPAQRAIDRAAKRLGRPHDDFEYDARTNRATVKKHKRKLKRK